MQLDRILNKYIEESVLGIIFLVGKMVETVWMVRVIERRTIELFKKISDLCIVINGKRQNDYESSMKTLYYCSWFIEWIREMVIWMQRTKIRIADLVYFILA